MIGEKLESAKKRSKTHPKVDGKRMVSFPDHRVGLPAFVAVEIDFSQRHSDFVCDLGLSRKFSPSSHSKLMEVSIDIR